MARRRRAAGRARARAGGALIGVLLALSAFAPASALGSTCVGNFETGDLSQWEAIQALSDDVAVVTDPVREGRYAAWFHVDADSVPFPQLRSNRADLYELTGESAGQESWWAWSTYFAESFVPNGNSTWNTFTAWHHDSSLYVAPISFAVNTRVVPWQISLQAWGGPPRIDPIYQKLWDLAPFERNRWYDFVFHVKWGDTPQAGFVEVWLDGRLVLPPTPAATLYTGEGVYVKQGFYRNYSSNVADLYHDGLRRGTSYEDLVAGECVMPPRPVAPTPPTPPSSQPSESSLRFLGRPRPLRGRRIAVRARAAAGVVVTVTVHSRLGTLLGRTRRQADAEGFISTRVPIPRWHGGRVLRVTLKYDNPPTVKRMLILSSEERRLARAF